MFIRNRVSRFCVRLANDDASLAEKPPYSGDTIYVLAALHANSQRSALVQLFVNIDRTLDTTRDLL
jgi:hypothetical protein